MSTVHVESRPQTAETTPTTAQLLAGLQRHCLLVSLTFHRWGGQYIVEGARVRLDGQTLNPLQVTEPRWRLMPQELKREIDHLEHDARKALDEVSVPFSLKGVHVVPLSQAAELFARLQGLRRKLAATVDEAVGRHYPDLVEEIRQRLGDELFDAAREHIPDREALARRFGLDWVILPLEAGAPLRDLRGAGAEAYIGEAEDSLGRMVLDSFEQMVRRPRQELAEAVANLAERIERHGVCKQGTLDRIRRAYLKLRGFRFLADRELLAQMRKVERALGGLTPQEVNQAEEGAAADMVTLLRELEKAARDESTITASLRQARYIATRAPGPDADQPPTPPLSTEPHPGGVGVH